MDFENVVDRQRSEFQIDFFGWIRFMFDNGWILCFEF